jgi:hypothetical protein
MLRCTPSAVEKMILSTQSIFDERKGKEHGESSRLQDIPANLHILPVKRVGTHSKPPAYRLSSA